MNELKNEKGYALIMVLAFIVIASLFAAPYLSTFLHDTQEIEIESLKNQNNYILESAVEITKAVVEENNLQTEDDLEEVVDLIEENSEELFNLKLNSSIDKENNKIVYATDGDFFNQRSNSTITLTYMTFDLTVFEDNKIVIRDNRENPQEDVNGNDHFEDSFIPQDVVGISANLFDSLVQQKYDSFASNYNEDDYTYYDSIDAELESSESYTNLWVDGSVTLRGKGSNIDLTITENAYFKGNVDLSKLDEFTVSGDLVVYDGSLDISNVDEIIVGGSIIVKGSIKITGSPEIKATNISASDIQINSGNSDIFPD